MATIIDHTFLMYHKAFEDWRQHPNDPQYFTDYGLCRYFINRHYVEYDFITFPELYMLGESHREHNLFYHFPHHGATQLGRDVRLKALETAMQERAFKMKFPQQFQIKTHIISISIRSIEQLDQLMEENANIYCSAWGRIMPARWFNGEHWRKAALKKYIDWKHFWLAHSIADRNAQFGLKFRGVY